LADPFASRDIPDDSDRYPCYLVVVGFWYIKLCRAVKYTDYFINSSNCFFLFLIFSLFFCFKILTTLKKIVVLKEVNIP